MSTEPQARPPPPVGAQSPKMPSQSQPAAPPHLPEDVVIQHILTRVPAAAVGCFRTVCRSWRDALTSDHFADAHRAARAAAASGAHHTPEIVFFSQAPPSSYARSYATAFYACKMDFLTAKRSNESASASAARELVTVGDACTEDLVLSGGTRPCRGLTLLHSRFDASAYLVCNLTTGEHVSLPRCATPAHCYWLSSAGLGFDPAAREHKVARLYLDADDQPRCEVYGLRSGGWRPCAGQVPPLAAAVDGWSLHDRPPVFVDGCFYWHVGPGAILSLAVSTEEFSWVPAPVRTVHRLAELDGSLCAVVELDPRLRIKHRDREPELWTRVATGSGGGSSAPSWTLRCRIGLSRLNRAIRNTLRRGRTMLPLATSSGGKILLATSCHEVYAYDPETGVAERVFSMGEFVNYSAEAEVRLNVALHGESVTSVRRRPMAGDDDDGGRLKVKFGSGTIARREGLANYRICGPEMLQEMIDLAMREARSLKR